MAGLKIECVTPDSLADEMEIVAGDRLLAINGLALRDLIDYSYFSVSEEQLLLEVEKHDGEVWEIEIERHAGESLGLTFSAPAPARCANNCLFCFVHQLPKGLRKPLYVKDEDYRLSFLNGNYVTLANLKRPALNRIIEQRLSPLYISVHTTDPDLREYLLGKTGVPPVLDQMRELAANRIIMHTQVVLCPGLNDGEQLQRTIDEMIELYPSVLSLAVVPLGLTAHRENLPQLTAVTSDYARDFISHWQPYAESIRKKLGRPFLFLADEFYLKADRPFPPIKAYGDFPQIENGVGMVPLFMKEATRLLRRIRPIGSFRVTVVTGVSSYDFVNDFLVQLAKKTDVEIVPLAVENRLFGSSITVSGLISGNDIRAAVLGHDIGVCLIIPDVMLKEGEGVFLDDVSLGDLEKRIGCRVVVFDSTPAGFYTALRSIGKKQIKEVSVR